MLILWDACGRLTARFAQHSYFIVDVNQQLVRQSQIVHRVMQGCEYVLSHLLPVCNLSVPGPKITYNLLVCQDGFKFY